MNVNVNVNVNANVLGLGLGLGLGLVNVLVLGCGPPDGIGDAGPSTIDHDAFVAPSCDAPLAISLVLADTPFAAGDVSDLHGAGAGAWAAFHAPDAPPGDILYVEAYAAGVEAHDGHLELTALEPWVDGCDVCVFLGRDCPAYALEGDADAPLAPTACDHLFLLHRGAVDVATLDDTALAATVSPLSGEDAIQLVEVGRSGDPTAPQGFGQPIAAGACVEVPPLEIDATW